MNGNSSSRPFWLLVVLSMAAILVAGSWLALSDHPVDASGDLSRIDQELMSILEEMASSEMIDVLIFLDQQNDRVPQDLPALEIGGSGSTIANLVERNNEAFSGLEPLINMELEHGGASFFRKLWIVNGAQLSASREFIEQLATRKEIDLIKLDQKIQFIDPSDLSSEGSANGLPWGIERIRATHVWNGLGITGDGVTVAIMDTGVDMEHTDLHANYRGNGPGNTVDHTYSWFDAVDATPSPADLNGHGTHVAGTAVGTNGIGVAPGASWIGVRVLDEIGQGQIGDIHAGFQWLLAPNGDPTKSPEIINGSWSGGPLLLDFIPDIALLREAGIIPIFAAGNTGPAIGSVGSPAGYQGTIAVGASDDEELLAWFSSRGPSAQTNEPKPTFTAPGTHILSADPSSGYLYRSGTSMATPHVSGLYALLLAAQPDLDEVAATAIITSSSLRVDGLWPNNNSGWGRVDAYAAVSQVAAGGLISGTLIQASEPIPGASIVVTGPLGFGLPFRSALDGSFQIKLLPGLYSMAIEKYGFTTYYTTGIDLEVDETFSLQVELQKIPGAKIQGVLFDSDTNSPISGTIKVLNTPVEEHVAADGQYEFDVPNGHYQVVASSLGHWNQQLTIDVLSSTYSLDFNLAPAPTTLLLDSGSWYYHQQLAYFIDALEDLGIGFNTWRIRNPLSDIPTAEDLTKYDVVVWSAPLDSPGYINAGSALSAYLAGGGNLLITGQDIGEFDGSAPFFEGWWFNQLKAEFQGSVTPTLVVSGEAGTTFSDIEFQLNGLDSASNQDSPDASRPRPDSFTEVAFRYQDGKAAGLQTSQCEPYKIVYLGFGLEGVAGRSVRKNIVERSYDYFDTPAVEAGVYLDPGFINRLVPRGNQAEIEFELINTSEIFTDTFHLELANSSWPTTVTTDTFTLGPCSAGKTSIFIDVPADLASDTAEEFQIILSSTNSETLQATLPVRLKTPGHILLVDDDRFYDQEPVYRQALDGIGLAFDFWDTELPPEGNGSPDIALLDQFDTVIWYTGYDWFQPLTSLESKNLVAYLAGGGKLLLTSQDFLYYHTKDQLTTTYLGIIDYQESIEPSSVIGNLSLGTPVGPYALNYGLYKNFSDGIVPGPTGGTLAWNDNGTTAGIASSGGSWRSVFWGLPVEKLPAAIRGEVLHQNLGWLTDLGDSTFESRYGVVAGSNQGNSTNYYTATIRNSSEKILDPVTVTNTLPVSLGIISETLTPGVLYHPDKRQISWTGSIQAGGTVSFSYAAENNGQPGTQVDNILTILEPRLGLEFERTARTWVGEADLTGSSIQVSPTTIKTGESGELEVIVRNDGYKDAVVSATINLSPGMSPVTPTLAVDSGSLLIGEQSIGWSVDLAPGSTSRATLVFTTTRQAERHWLPATLVVRTNQQDPLVRTAIMVMDPYQFQLPLFIQDRKH